MKHLLSNTLVACLLTALSSQSFAFGGSGTLVGNGGDAIICKNPQGQITSAQFFDLYEAKEKFGMTIVPPQGANLDEKVLNLIDRVAGIDLIRALVMKKWYSTFKQESFFKSGIKLVDVPDTGDAFWPQGCDLAQLVVQTELDPPLKPYRYVFSEDIWKLLDDNSKAATIIHELLWREGRIVGHDTSAAIRYFNGLFQSSGFASLTDEQYSDLISKLRLGIRSTRDGYPIGFPSLYTGVEFPTDFGSATLLPNGSAISESGWSYAEGIQIVGSPRLPSSVTFDAGQTIQVRTSGLVGLTFLESKGFYLPEYKYRPRILSFSRSTKNWIIGYREKLEISILPDQTKTFFVNMLTDMDDEFGEYPIEASAFTISEDQRFVASFTPVKDFSLAYRDNYGKWKVTCKAGARVDLERLITNISTNARMHSCVVNKDHTIYNFGRRKETKKVRAGTRIYWKEDDYWSLQP